MFVDCTDNKQDRNEHDEVNNLLPLFSLLGQLFVPFFALLCDGLIYPVLLTALLILAFKTFVKVIEDWLEFR